MPSKSYTTIFVLLSFCVLSILALQGFWIRNFYIQKTDEFNRNVYQCLDRIAEKLNERENIHIIKKSFDTDSIPDSHTAFEMQTNGMTTVSSPQVRIINKISSKTLSPDGIIISDSIVHISNNKKTVIVSKSLNNEYSKKSEIDKLVGKMMLEIKSLDVSLTDSIHKDTLANLIKRQLAYKGIFTPFEFSLRKNEKGKQKTLLHSGSFNEKTHSFHADLASRHVFSNPYLLLVQFPSQTGFVFAAMKNTLILSALFSLVIIVVFFFTIRTILNQKKLAEIKNDFINNMTHELKTPIATISLAVDAINNPVVKQDEEKLNSYTRILKEENNKLTKQVERVLEIAQLDKGEMVLHKKTTDLNAIISSVIASFALQINDKQAKVDVIPSPGAIINGDEQHIFTVFSNLLDNALKYSPENCAIEIRIENLNDNIIVRFKDNGIGIDRNAKDKIFEKFYRVQGGNLHDVKGFGLGLSYVKSIVEAHDGQIEVRSEINKGSEFILTFKAYAD